MSIQLIPLPFAYDALEPFIDTQTMILHHDKHHASYVSNLNTALEKHPELMDKPLETLLSNLGSVPEDIRTAIRNHGGGTINHDLFWQVMAPKAGGEPKSELAKAINSAFSSFSGFKAEFEKAAMSRFGSGWVWLIKKGSGLSIISTANQDTPISDGFIPILGLDVWEHAYYLKYQNRRAEYVGNWWNVVNWPEVQRRLLEK
jgi:superoxide dismutase, Fe-Mn family